MSARHNPRRAYHADGTMISPLTVGDHLRAGFSLVEITCSVCSHYASIDVTNLPPDLPIPDIALRSRCTKCGSRCCTSAPDIIEYYKSFGVTAKG